MKGEDSQAFCINYSFHALLERNAFQIVFIFDEVMIVQSGRPEDFTVYDSPTTKTCIPINSHLFFYVKTQRHFKHLLDKRCHFKGLLSLKFLRNRI